MAKGEHKGERQKLKMLYLAKILSQETDDTHSLTMDEILQRLADYGVNADRRTMYRDFDELRVFGMDIIKEKRERNCFYHLASREFELPEVKLLVDAVQSSRFITNSKSRALIKKLETLTSKYEARELHRQVIITGRVKSMNESIYYNVDKIQKAISAGKKLRYRYVQWDLNKRLVPRHEGAWYEISPWSLMWDNQQYYMLGYDSQEEKIKHYRVDKMQNISVTESAREGREAFRQMNIPRYANSLFKMFGGEEKVVTLEAENDMVGVILDRFGKDTLLRLQDEDHFQADVSVAVSSQFLGWVLSMDGKVRIVSPGDVVEEMRALLSRVRDQY